MNKWIVFVFCTLLGGGFSEKTNTWESSVSQVSKMEVSELISESFEEPLEVVFEDFEGNIFEYISSRTNCNKDLFVAQYSARMGPQ
jgi:hypothetical protein